MTERTPPGDRRSTTPDGRQPLSCPACGSEDVREIRSKLTYDRSGFDFEVYHLGGCTIPVERWLCADCGKEW
jgi:transposase-like protein